MPKPAEKTPMFMETAHAFYADAFQHGTRRDLARSIAEWSEMEEDEQSFAVAHLLYLNLQAQAGIQRALLQVRDLLDEVAEGLTTVIEASMGEEREEEPEARPAFEADFDDQVPEGYPVAQHPVPLEGLDGGGEEEPDPFDPDGDYPAGDGAA